MSAKREALKKERIQGARAERKEEEVAAAAVVMRRKEGTTEEMEAGKQKGKAKARKARRTSLKRHKNIVIVMTMWR